MKRFLPVILLFLAALLAGCSAGGTPEAITPETEHNFGNVPVTNNMNEAKLKWFSIKNSGSAALRLSDIQVKTLEGC